MRRNCRCAILCHHSTAKFEALSGCNEWWWKPCPFPRSNVYATDVLLDRAALALLIINGILGSIFAIYKGIFFFFLAKEDIEQFDWGNLIGQLVMFVCVDLAQTILSGIMVGGDFSTRQIYPAAGACYCLSRLGAVVRARKKGKKKERRQQQPTAITTRKTRRRSLRYQPNEPALPDHNKIQNYEQKCMCALIFI